MISSQMETPFSIRSLILRVLLDGPGYGADLSQRIALLTEGKTVLSPGALYPALKGLLEENLIVAEDDPAPSAKSGRPRTSFRLTDTGEARVKELQKQANTVWVFDPTPGKK